RLVNVRVAPVRVLVHARERRCDRGRARGRQRQLRDVSVEAHDLYGVEPGAVCQLLRRGRPGVRREAGSEGPHRWTAAACPGSAGAARSSPARRRPPPSPRSTTTSDGPAGRSMATSRATASFASFTYGPPGPTILSTRAT